MGTIPISPVWRASPRKTELTLDPGPVSRSSGSVRAARGGVIYQQCLCFVAQGTKRAYLGERVYRYDPMHYLMLSAPLPLETKTRTPPRPAHGLASGLSSRG